MELPIFPLNGAVLFPGTSLPLNIFENRYLKMVNYSLARDRLIGMIQSDKNKNLYNIGCVGKIHSFSETDDGRYLISLQGTTCFKVIEELKVKYSFRFVNAGVLNHDESRIEFTDAQKNNLIEKYKNFIKIKGLNFNLEEIEKIDFSQIIKFFAMISPFNNIDKQALLETNDISEFYDKLLSIIELGIVGDFSNNTIN